VSGQQAGGSRLDGLAIDGRRPAGDEPEVILPSGLPTRLRERLGAAKRVLFFGKSMSRTRCTGGLVDALQRHGLEVRWRNLVTLRRWFGVSIANKMARAEFRRFRPDVVMAFHTDLPPQLAAEFRESARVVIWCEEPLVAIGTGLIDYFQLADLVCLSNPTRMPLLQEQGLDNLAFLMSGFSPRFHRPAKAQPPRRDVAFIGTPGRLGQRAELLAEVAKKFDVEVYGLHWNRWPQYCRRIRVNPPIGNREYAQVCATSKVVLGMNEVNDDAFYFSNRTFLTLACRAFHLTHYVPRLEQVFHDGEHLAWFRGVADVHERIQYWLAPERDEERARIAGVGLAEVMQKHQYYHRVASILHWLQHGLPKSELELHGLHGRRRDGDPEQSRKKPLP
jgi:hypothetical protein